MGTGGRSECEEGSLCAPSEQSPEGSGPSCRDGVFCLEMNAVKRCPSKAWLKRRAESSSLD